MGATAQKDTKKHANQIVKNYLEKQNFFNESSNSIRIDKDSLKVVLINDSENSIYAGSSQASFHNDQSSTYTEGTSVRSVVPTQPCENEKMIYDVTDNFYFFLMSNV